MVLDYNKSPYQIFVAKYSKEGNWLPYYAHLMDTAGIIERLRKDWLPAHITEVMSERAPSVEWDKLCVFIALVHDIGKATPVFQSKICDKAPYLKERILDFGINLKGVSDFIEQSKTPHSFSGEAILIEAGCPEGIAAIVGSHHGTPFSETKDIEDIMSFYEENFYGQKGKTSNQGHMWDNIWKQWIEISLKLSGYDSIEELPEIDIPTQIILTGLLMMSDWIASNEMYAPLISQDKSGVELKYPERIDSIWKRVSFPEQWLPSCWFMDDAIFKEKYGFYPNEMQRQVLNAVEDASTPGIYIIEAQMGLGKTEAALCAAEILASKWHCEGVFFGLPTQATANGIFPRIKSWTERQSDGNLLSIKLAHGTSMLQKDYRDLFHGYACQNEDDDNENLIVHSWFEGRKQVLLSSFVIGTVDQLLMAALKQKHVMLRHLGLAGKVVVIDECHAYDAYMNCYLERALEWLGIYRVPVILLSATLPADRRAKLIGAYNGNNFSSEPFGWRDSKAYPLLTYTDGNDIRQYVIPVDTTIKKIEIVRAETNETVKILKEKLTDGGCAGVILNTVAQAQMMAREIRENMPDYTVLLIHARFTMSDRQKIEEEILRRLGKASNPEMRHLIVVGTQILEQSLDIDFDFLITQLAPMDLLLQRIGRLHRHGYRERPESLVEPVCVVCGCEESDESSRQIYGDWLLKRTRELLPDKIYLPTDISPLVQETYRNMTEVEELYPCWIKQMEDRKIKERKAAAHRILSKKDLEETMHGFLDNYVRDSDVDAQARVRDGDSSIEVLLMVQMEEDDKVGFFPWQENGDKVPMDHVPSENECRNILLQRVQLPRSLSVYRYDKCVAHLEQQNRTYLEEWQYSRWLQGELVLLLSEDLTTELCGFTLRYDNQYGLICEKEK